MLSFILNPLYVEFLPSKEEFGELSVVFAWMLLFNVILAYGMETSFFRFFHQKAYTGSVAGTASISLLLSTGLFFVAGWLSSDFIASATAIDAHYILLVIGILALDALVIVPFAWLRATERPIRYGIIKIGNVAINLGLNVFFLVILPSLAERGIPLLEALYRPGFEISYIFIADIERAGGFWGGKWGRSWKLQSLSSRYARLKF